MLSTLVSLYKLLGTGNFFKVLLLLLKAILPDHLWKGGLFHVHCPARSVLQPVPHQPAGNLVDPLGALVPVTRRP